MEIAEIALRFIGVLYALGSFAAIHMMAMSELLSRAIAMIDLKQNTGSAAFRRWVERFSAVQAGTSGVALAMLSQWAVPLLFLSTALQLVWLFWARHAEQSNGSRARRGQNRSTNAALGQAVVLLGVVWLANEGRLAPFADPVAGAAILAAAAALSAYLAYRLHLAGMDPPYDEDEDGGEPEAETGTQFQPSRIQVILSVHHNPLVDADDGRILDHFAILPPELASRIGDWHARHLAAGSDGDGLDAGDAPARVLAGETEAILAELRMIYGRENVLGPQPGPMNGKEA